MNKQLLIDKKQLLECCPALNKWSLEYLCRHRRIPLVKVGKRIYFDPEDIEQWISENKIEARREGK